LCEEEDKVVSLYSPYFCLLKKEVATKIKVGVIIAILFSVLLVGVLMGFLLYRIVGMHDYEEIFDHSDDKLSECKDILSAVNMMRESRMASFLFEEKEKSLFLIHDIKNFFFGPSKLLKKKDLPEDPTELKDFVSDQFQLYNDRLLSKLPPSAFKSIMMYTLESEHVRGVPIEKICSYATKYPHFEEYDDISIFFNYFNIDLSLIRKKKRNNFFVDNNKMCFNIPESEIENI
jgi:hypothetical protein